MMFTVNVPPTAIENGIKDLLMQLTLPVRRCVEWSTVLLCRWQLARPANTEINTVARSMSKKLTSSSSLAEAARKYFRAVDRHFYSSPRHI
jgi:hypothetical protein